MGDEAAIFPAETAVSQLGTKAVSSAVVLGVRRIVFQFIITGSNIFLARLLFPEVFGAFTILIFILGFFGYFADIGFAAALVQQKEEPSDKQLRSVFTIQFLLVLIITLVLWLLAPFIIGYYGGQISVESIGMLRLLVLTFPIAAGGGISKTLLERNLRYTHLSIAEFLSLVVGRGLAILLAFSGFGLLALVYSEFFSRLIGTVALFLLHPWRIGFSVRFRDISSLFSFGFPFQLAAIIGLVNGAVIPVYIGKYPGPGGWSGPQAVGFIVFAAGLAGFSNFFSDIIGQLTFPVISRAQGDSARVRRALERALEISALTSFGLIAILFVLSREIIAIVYTDKWFPALPLLWLLLLQSAEIAVGLILANGLLALGESKTYRNLQILWAVLEWAFAVPLVLAMGFVGLGYASVLVSVTGVLVPWWLLRKRLSFSFFSTFLPEAGVACLTFFGLFFLRGFVSVHSIWSLLFLGGMGAFLYSLLALLLLRRRVTANIVYLFGIVRMRMR